MNASSKYTKELLAYLEKNITEQKRALMDKILQNRTRHLTIVLENLFQSQNGSAAIRTAECLGIQDIHIIENENSFGTNKGVLKGSYKWVSLYRYSMRGIDNTQACFTKLKEEGYTILVSDPATDGMSIHDVDVSAKIALVLGSEKRGPTDYALRHAHKKIFIPMYGFTESFNVSVSAAIGIYTLIQKMRQSDIIWHLNESEQTELRLQWVKRIIKRSSILEKAFEKKHLL